MSAPREMRCRSMFTMFMTTMTIASVNGMATATTAPGRKPKTEHADAQNDEDRLPERSRELADGDIDRGGLVGDQHRIDADRQIGLDCLHH